MANFITNLRIVFSIILLLCPALSIIFFIIYLISGFSDMIDGTVARKTNTVSEFGSKLDTVADFIFVIVCFIKLIPKIDIPNRIYIWVAIIFLIKVINVLYGFLLNKKFMTVHTVMNKITGLALFILPLSLSFVDIKYSAPVVCLLATFSAIQEGKCILKKVN